MKADKHEMMRHRGDWELSRALKRMEIGSGSVETVKMRSVDESVAVEFGTVDNLGDNNFRYKYDSLSYTHF